MWYCYGDTRYPLDTSMTNAEGTAIFENDYQLTGGVFILYLTPRKALEFLLTDENIFTIQIDTSDISGKTAFLGSKENSIYYDFLRKINFNNYQADLLKRKLKQKNLPPDSLALLKNMIESYRKQEDMIKKQVAQKNKGLFIADLIAAQLKPEVSRDQKVGLWQRETKKRYFENVNFANERLAFSPVLHNLYEEYIEDWTARNGDSLIAACDTILKKAAAGKENFKWSLYYLSSYFERMMIAGQDKAFVHLVEEYYKKGKSWWLTQAQLDNMVRRSELLKHLFVGSICPDFTAQDTSGKETSLHKKIKGITILYFWAYDCKHCLDETPKLAAWMKTNPKINLVSACTSPDEEKWKEKLKEFKLPGTHLIDPELKANYAHLYSITATPQIFVLDKNKKIIAKYIDDTKGLEDFLKGKK